MKPELAAVRKRLLTDFPFYSKASLKIRTKTGEIAPLKLNPAQKILQEAVDKQMKTEGKVRVIILKARQQGLSTYTGWDRCRCPDLPSGIDWAVFDFAVNAGTGRAAKTLQRAVEAEEDGSIGPLTLMLVKKHESTNVINRMAIYREDFYRSLSNFDHFGRGWLRRNDETREQALALL